MAHLTNPLATATQLFHRSSFSNLPRDLQEAIFITSQCLTQAAGRLLELPQSITAQANVILARYWLVDSPMAYEFSVGSKHRPHKADLVFTDCVKGYFGSCPLPRVQNGTTTSLASRHIERLRLSHI